MTARTRLQARLTAVALGTTLGLAAAATALSNLGWAGTPWAGIVEEQEREAERQEEARQRTAKLRARVQPRSPARAFDLAAMRPRPSISAEAELQALLLDLRRAREHHERGSYFASLRDTDSAADRMAFFDWRFGVAPEQVSGWTPIALEARELLAEASRNREGHKPCAFCINDKNVDGASAHVLLLELAGRIPEADERLAATEVSHWCGNCADSQEAVLRQRRSEVAARRGDLASALAILSREGRLTPSARGVDDLVVTDAHGDAWRGMLLLANGREDDGVLVLQQVVDLFPGTAAAEVARAALEQVGALVEPSAGRLLAVYVEPFESGSAASEPGSGWHGPLAISAYGAYRTGDVFERLNVWFDKFETSALEGMVRLRSERARSIFELQLTRGDLDEVEVPLTGLAALNGGLRPYADRLLERLAAHDGDEIWCNLTRIDDPLRSCFGTGPAIEELDELDYQHFARVWQDWIAAQAAPK